MKNKLIVAIKLVFGLFVFALGVVFTMNAGIGVAPWDVFHQGISKVTGITVGRANIYMGMIIIILDIVLGQAIGWATVCNMILIGTFMDILMLNNLVPIFQGFLPSLIMLILGMIIEGYGCYLYISAGLGAGPRDGLMVVLTNKTGKPVGIIKSIIEICAVTVGFILGGNLGIGTLIMAIFTGQIWEIIFKSVNFNVSGVEHRFIQDDIQYLKEKIKG
ncbi:YczE/YyaS/YitT family protein [Tissierellaceae bacterium HCP3S3_D8]